MRALLLLAALAACTTTVRDLPAGKAPAEQTALLAGRLGFGSAHLKSAQGKRIVLRPQHRSFLVAVPPGLYAVERFGKYQPKADRLTVEARAGACVYIGTFQPVRDEEGELRVRVLDEPGPVAEDLARRYGAAAPALEPGFVASSLEPLERGGALVVAVQPVVAYHPYPRYGFGFGYFFYRHGHHHHHRHHPRPRHRGFGVPSRR